MKRAMNRKGTICFIIPSLSSGGSERVVSVLATSLEELGYDVTVIKYFEAENEYPISKWCKVINLSSGDEKAYKSIPFIKKIFMLRTALKKVGAEYTVPFLPHVAIHVWLASVGIKSKYIQTVRNAPDISPASKLLRVIRDYLITKSYRTFVQTESQKKYFHSKVQKKIVVLPNPVSDKMLWVKKELKGITHIVSIGRLTEQKNFRMAIDSVCLLQGQGYEVQLSIYGEGELRKDLEAYITQSNANGFCKLCGRSNDVSKVLLENDLFILSSNFEGMPNSLMEAMAVGLPCVATDCETGPFDLIGNDRGILVPVNDYKAMSEAIKFLLDHPSTAKKMGAVAKEYMQNNYSPKQIALRFVNEVMEGN